MSHHGVRCDYVVFLSAFAGTGIADNSDPLLGASLTASLALLLEPLGGTGHRAQGTGVGTASYALKYLGCEATTT